VCYQGVSTGRVSSASTTRTGLTLHTSTTSASVRPSRLIFHHFSLIFGLVFPHLSPVFRSFSVTFAEVCLCFADFRSYFLGRRTGDRLFNFEASRYEHQFAGLINFANALPADEYAYLPRAIYLHLSQILQFPPVFRAISGTFLHGV